MFTALHEKRQVFKMQEKHRVLGIKSRYTDKILHNSIIEQSISIGFRSGKPVSNLTVGFDSEWQDCNTHNLILSYQFYVVEYGFGILLVMKDGCRLKLEDLIFIIYHSLGVGEKRKLETINLVSHFTRADMFALTDLEQSLVKFKSIKAIQKTFASVMENNYVFLDVNEHRKAIKFRLVDTLLLSDKRSLKKIGKSINIEKIEIGDRIKDMKSFLNEDPALFAQYAMNDAVICSIFFKSFLEICKGLNVNKTPVTASGLAELYFESNVVDYQKVLGYNEVLSFHYDSNKNQIVGREHMSLSKQVYYSKISYYGGRNEAYMFGIYTEKWFDYDVKNAYPSALLTLQDIDWDHADSVKSITDIEFNDVGYIWLKFKFRKDVKYPMFPIKYHDSLIYVQEGETIITLTEFYTAVKNDMLEKYEILTGVKFRRLNDLKIPHLVAKLINERNKYDKDDINNLIYKLIANSIYGKLTQGIKKKNGLDLQASIKSENFYIVNTKSRASGIYNPALAGYVTGFIRSIIGEYLHCIHTSFPAANIISVTTDGFVTNIELPERFYTGRGMHLCEKLSDARKHFVFDASILELKHQSTVDSENYCIETRNYWMSKGDKLLVAKGGVQTAAKETDGVIKELTDMFLNLKSKYKQRSLTTIQQFLANQYKDLLTIESEHTKNWDFDFKRQINENSVTEKIVKTETGECVKKLCFDTIPFKNLEEYTYMQEVYVKYLKAHTNINKIQTLDDYKKFREFFTQCRIADGHTGSLRSVIERKIIVILLLKHYTPYNISKMLNIAERNIYQIETSKNYQEIKSGKTLFKRIPAEMFEMLEFQQFYNSILEPLYTCGRLSNSDIHDLKYHIKSKIKQSETNEVYHSPDYMKCLSSDSLLKDLDCLIEDFNAGKLSL